MTHPVIVNNAQGSTKKPPDYHRAIKLLLPRY